MLFYRKEKQRNTTFLKRFQVKQCHFVYQSYTRILYYLDKPHAFVYYKYLKIT